MQFPKIMQANLPMLIEMAKTAANAQAQGDTLEILANMVNISKSIKSGESYSISPDYVVSCGKFLAAFREKKFIKTHP